MERVILHADLNCFYAAVECLYHPEIRRKPVAVCGDPELRHGIVLTKNQRAKELGVTTGEAIWQAKRKAPELVVMKPNYPLYLRFAKQAREIYCRYTDRVEPFGLDEAWLDVSAPGRGVAEGARLADEIRDRMRRELGLTISVGVSYNKVFAKLGSDMRKPDATTAITRENYRSLVWPLPAAELLYVGRATRRKLARLGILTIGELARSDPELLRGALGKWGYVLHGFANGWDYSPVGRMGEEELIQSIGNSTTTPRDLESDAKVRTVIYVLAESVAARLREHGFRCGTVQIHVRDSDLIRYERQAQLAQPSDLSGEIAALAMALFTGSYGWHRPVRSLGVRACGLRSSRAPQQLALWEDGARAKAERMERAVDEVRRRFGYFSLQRGVVLEDRDIRQLNPREEHVIHPVGFFPGNGV